MTGWVKIHRALADHDLWLAEPFTYGQAWVDLVLCANHASGSFMVKRQRVALERGQIGWSEITMTKRWKWSRGKVRRFLKRLESDSMIKQETGHLTSVITICNYDSYQSKSKEDGTSDSTADGTALGTPDEHLTVHEAVHKQECKELENDKNEKKTTLPAAAVKPSVDFSVFNASDDQIAEMKRIRRLNKGGAMSQRVVNSLAKEFHQASQMGHTFDDCLTEWETAGWKSMKADWVHNRIGGNNGSHQQASKQSGQIDHDDTSWADDPALQRYMERHGGGDQQDLQGASSDIPGLEAGLLIDGSSRRD